MVRADGVLCFVSHASIEMMMMEFFFLQELFPLKNEKKTYIFPTLVPMGVSEC